MTLEGPNGQRYLVRKDCSFVMDGDGYARPLGMPRHCRRYAASGLDRRILSPSTVSDAQGVRA